MPTVLVDMLMIEWQAKAMHYNANGLWFYALHLLADKVDFGSAADDIKEAYYLGFVNTPPPTEKEIAASAVESMNIAPTADNKMLVTNLKAACEAGVQDVENAKREPGLPGGIHAILDGISQKMLTVIGLCANTLKGMNVA